MDEYKNFAIEFNEFLFKHTLDLSGFRELKKSLDSLEEKANKEFKGVLMRGTVIDNIHIISSLSIAPNNRLYTHNLTNNEASYLALEAFNNMKCISTEDLTTKEFLKYKQYLEDISTQSQSYKPLPGWASYESHD